MTYLCDITSHVPRSARLLCGMASLTLIWLVTVYIISPTGNFPLNDDWSFGTTALTYYRTGQYIPGDFPAMSLITNVVLAVPFIHFLGDTFESLRVSSLFYHWLSAVFVFYASVKNHTVVESFLIAAAVLFSPLPFILSFTFMTESLFQLLCVLIILVVIKNRDKYPFLLTALSVLATLSRQIVIPALLLPLVYNWKSNVSIHKLLRCCIPLFVSGACYIVYRWWLESINRMPANQSSSSLTSMIDVIRYGKYFAVVGNIQQAILLLGFLLFPALLLFFAHEIIFRRLKLFFVFLALTITTVVGKGVISNSSMLFPYSNNVISPYGFGPLILSFDSRITWSLPLPILAASSVISIIGGAIVLAISYERIKRICVERSLSQESRIFYFSGILVLPSVFIDPMYDRYVAIVIATVILTLVSRRHKLSPNSINVVCCLVAVAYHVGFCIMAGSDYMNIQRARSRAYEFLIKDVKANPRTIDAGFEYNGLINYRHDYVATHGKHFWMEDVRYGVGFQTPRKCKQLYKTSIGIFFGTQSVDLIAYEVNASPSKNSVPVKVPSLQ
jgi:hypothetical protein